MVVKDAEPRPWHVLALVYKHVAGPLAFVVAEDRSKHAVADLLGMLYAGEPGAWQRLFPEPDMRELHRALIDDGKATLGIYKIWADRTVKAVGEAPPLSDVAAHQLSGQFMRARRKNPEK